jgi:steroid delta-isomerase-like uncharacterized protein
VSALEERWREAWSAPHDAAAFAPLCAPDVHYEDPLTSTPLQGTRALGEHAARLWRAFPDVTLEAAGSPLRDGRLLAIPTRARGRNTGELDGLPASHRELTVHIVFWCELEPDGARMWRVRALFDAFGAAVTLGLVPRPGSLRSRAVLALQGYGLRLG